MAVLRKASFHSVDICNLMKNQSCKKKGQGGKLIQTLIFSKLSSLVLYLHDETRSKIKGTSSWTFF